MNFVRMAVREPCTAAQLIGFISGAMVQVAIPHGPLLAEMDVDAEKPGRELPAIVVGGCACASDADVEGEGRERIAHPHESFAR